MQTLTVKAREPAYSVRNGAPLRSEPGLADIVKSTAADVVHLATAELRLAKLEVTEGIRAQAGRVALLAAAAVPLLVAYLMALGALVVWVRPMFGWAGTLALVALSQAVLGAVLVDVASPRRKAKASPDIGKAGPAAGGDAGGAGGTRA